MIGNRAALKSDLRAGRTNRRRLPGVTFARSTPGSSDRRVAVERGLCIVVPNLAPSKAGARAGDGDRMRFGAKGLNRAGDEQIGSARAAGNAVHKHDGVRLNGESVAGWDGDVIRDIYDAAPGCSGACQGATHSRDRLT